MGGCCCCCCSSEAVELNSASSYYYYPRASDEHVPFSSQHGAVPAPSTGLLVDTNLDTSVADAHRSPPVPIPFDLAPRVPHNPQGAEETYHSKSDGAVQTTNSGSDQEIVGVNTQETLTMCEDKESDCRAQTDLELSLTKGVEIELSKTVESLILEMEQEVCPTCLEEYDAENPKITTKCEHHFHLSCILEWKERSYTCPVCDQEMVIDPPID